MKNAFVDFSEKNQWIKKWYFFMGFGFSIILVFAYAFAWIGGANLKAVLISGLCLLVFNILLFVFLYWFTLKLAKRHLKKEKDINTE